MNPFYLLALSGIVLVSVSQTLLKKSANKTWPSPIRQYLNLYVIAGYGMLGIGLLLGLVCYKYLGYMETVILEPLSYIAILLIGSIVFGEKLTARKILGMCLIIVGILIFNIF